MGNLYVSHLPVLLLAVLHFRATSVLGVCWAVSTCHTKRLLKTTQTLCKSRTTTLYITYTSYCPAGCNGGTSLALADLKLCENCASAYVGASERAVGPDLVNYFVLTWATGERV